MAPRVQFSTYACVSTALTAALVSYAFQTRIQFYPAVIFLVTSKISLLILGNMGLMMTLLLGRITKAVFFGQLRDVEIEILYDNARYAVTETCLALTIFREELTTRVLTLFTALLFSKSFHWLCQSRVEYVESDNVSRWTHIRLVTLMVSLLAVDIAFVSMCVYLWRGPSVLILFGFEYTILALSVLSTLIRYLLHVIDMSIEGNWPQKGSYIFFLEFVTEVVRFISYVIFFTIIFTYYGMPLHIVRDLWTSYVNLKRRLIIFTKYRKLTANMNERFPDATPEELAACEHTCIICRDAMDGGKKLPCTHIFHLECLRLWLQHQQSCPTCRADIPTDATPPPVQPPNAAPQPPMAPPAAPHGAGFAAPNAPMPHDNLRAGGPMPMPMATPGQPPNFPHPPAMPPHPLVAPFGFPVPHAPNAFPFYPPPAWAPPPHMGPQPGAAFGLPPALGMPRGAPEPPRWFKVIHKDGATVRSSPAPDSPIIKVIPKDEVVMCIHLLRQPEPSTHVAYFLLNGVVVEDTGSSPEAAANRVFEPTEVELPRELLDCLGAPLGFGPSHPAASREGAHRAALPPHLPRSFLSCPPSPSRPGIGARGGGSLNLGAKEEVQASQAVLHTVLRDMNTLVSTFSAEMSRLDAALARLDAGEGREARAPQEASTGDSAR